MRQGLQVLLLCAACCWVCSTMLGGALHVDKQMLGTIGPQGPRHQQAITVVPTAEQWSTGYWEPESQEGRAQAPCRSRSVITWQYWDL